MQGCGKFCLNARADYEAFSAGRGIHLAEGLRGGLWPVDPIITLSLPELVLSDIVTPIGGDLDKRFI